MIWLIGNKGMLGNDVEILLRKEGLDFIATDMDIDITDYELLNRFAERKRIDWIINCSAYTAVDKAEDEPEKAFKINADGVKNIAKVAMFKNARLIHISTDYVFNGRKKKPYTESDPPNPIGVYGKSKLLGEENIKSVLASYFIIRTAWLYGKNGNNFVNTMLKLFNIRDEVKVVSDQFGSPTYTVDLAKLILKIIENNSENYGIYHFTNEGKISWFDFASKIYEIAKEIGTVKKEVKVIPISNYEYTTKAKRPIDSYMSKEKVKEAFGIKIRPWDKALREFLLSLNIEEK